MIHNDERIKRKTRKEKKARKRNHYTFTYETVGLVITPSEHHIIRWRILEELERKQGKYVNFHDSMYTDGNFLFGYIQILESDGLLRTAALHHNRRIHGYFYITKYGYDYIENMSTLDKL